MSPTPIPTRITIDFRADIHPSRAWILGLGATDRADLLAFDGPSPRLSGSSMAAAMDRGRPTAESAPCACPDFCERDHPNE
jgi:hypothetical protein